MEIKFNGEHTFPVPREVLWTHLNDPKVLTVCLPGCTGMEQIGEDVYETSLKLQVASVGGTFTGKIALTDKVEPAECHMQMEGSGTIGHATGRAAFELEEVSDSETRMVYTGTGDVGGLVAGVGQRVLGGVTKYLTRRFLTTLDKYLADEAVAAKGDGNTNPS